MKVEKLSLLESYNLDLSSFNEGEYFAEDIEDENSYYDRLYVLVDKAHTIFALAYIYIKEENSIIEVDLLTAKGEGDERDYKIDFLQSLKEGFHEVQRIILKGASHEEEDLLNSGFKHDRPGYMVWDKGSEID